MNQAQKDLWKVRLSFKMTKSLLSNQSYDAVRKSPLNLVYVDQPNTHHAYIAVSVNGLSIRFLSDKLKTEEICLEAVKQNSLAIQYIPTELQTLAIAKEAYKNNSSGLQYICGDIMDEMLEDLNNTPQKK